MCWLKSVWLTGGVDFITTTLTATFDSGMTMSSVSVPVIDDMIAEGKNETFNLMLIVPSSLGPAIRAGRRNRAVGVIIDTTGEWKYHFIVSSKNMVVSLIAKKSRDTMYHKPMTTTKSYTNILSHIFILK